MLHADIENTLRLSKGFHELTKVVTRFQNEKGYWQDLEKRWNRGISVTVLPD